MPLNIYGKEVNPLAGSDEAAPLRERLRPLQARVIARPVTGLEADKAFYDNLSAPEPAGAA